MGIWTAEGLRDKTMWILGQSAGYGFTLRLYVVDLIPSTATVAADFTECTLPGYAALDLVPSQWTLTVGNFATAIYVVVEFTFLANPGGVSVYGYFITNPNTKRSAFAERFAAPYPVPLGGGTLTVQLTITESNP